MVSSFVLQMLLPMNVADILPLQYIATIGRLMLMPVADGIATCCLLFVHFCFMGRCYCPVRDGIATFFVLVMADVIAQCQMEWPLQGCECIPPGRCCSQGADGCGYLF